MYTTLNTDFVYGNVTMESDGSIFESGWYFHNSSTDMASQLPPCSQLTDPCQEVAAERWSGGAAEWWPQ